MNQRIKYIGYFTLAGIRPERTVPLAGRNKMEYTIGVLEKIFNGVDVISPACTKSNEKRSRSTISKFGKKSVLKLFSMLANKNRITSRINFEVVKVKLLWFLLFNTKKDEPVLLYHSLAVDRIVLLAKKIKKFKLILELNEIYSDVDKSFESYRQQEIKAIRSSDAFIFSNDLLNGMYNTANKPFAVGYGIYTASKQISSKFDDGKIHIVYAGTFDSSKGGAFAATACAAHLPDKYHLHILGFGNENQIKSLNNLISSVNAQKKCEVSYDGKLDGDEFIAFLQKCHIGLSTQNPDAPFNATSFPSKILTYLANGLQVVSIDIPAISKSCLAQDITFYSQQSPECIAEAITRIDCFTRHDNILSELDSDFTNALQHVFNSL